MCAIRAHEFGAADYAPLRRVHKCIRNITNDGNSGNSDHDGNEGDNDDGGDDDFGGGINDCDSHVRAHDGDAPLEPLALGVERVDLRAQLVVLHLCGCCFGFGVRS